MTRWRLRSSEWIALSFFGYVALLTPFFADRPRLHLQPIVLLLLISFLISALAVGERGPFARSVSMIRDWLPLGLTLTAFREMELFVTPNYNRGLEIAWERWDVILLKQWGLTRAIEALGAILPGYLELCYLLVYGVGVYVIVALWFDNEREKVDRVMSIYLVGTLLAYAFFPFFPSRPPRLVFPGVDEPNVTTWFKTVNWFVLGKATIHAAVFPSAHVSSAFAAAWAMFIVNPRRRLRAWGFLAYAVSVSLSTIYGRYHYTADVLAGLAVSLVALLFGVTMERRLARSNRLNQSVSAGSNVIA